MNRIRESMEGIRASRELKANTLEYLERQRSRCSRPVWRRGVSYVLAAAMCLLLMLGVGGYTLYGTPTSYISMDVNPSIELEINRYGRVVAAEAYNADGQDVLQHLSLKNKPYVQAVSNLLEDEVYKKYLVDNATLVFTIISDSPEVIREELNSIDVGKSYQVLTYTSDSHCMEEAHQYEMSFGKYRAYLELAEYDRSVTVEDCHGMSMEEIQNRIEGCRQHEESEHHENHGWNGYAGQENNDVSQGDGVDQEDSEINPSDSMGQKDSEISQSDSMDQEDSEISQSDGMDQENSDTGQGSGGYGGHHGGHHNR